MTRRKLLLGAGAIALVGGWYLFRPERLFINQTVNEEFPEAAAMTADAPAPLLGGMFHSNAHETGGSATIHRLADGSLTLRLTDFHTSNGPDVQVYLVAANDVNDDATVTSAGFINLGALKGNIGDQNYVVPTDVDLSKYRAVTIWCRRFSVNFGTAPLS
ncbi:MAG: DM13 domain-containing protein [Gemmatimonadetes bacterium]|nr:DM13 domain-containing protein [Gemmatimonadota bacterium]